MSGSQLKQYQINVIGGLTRFIEDFKAKDFGTIDITTKDASTNCFIKKEYIIPEASYSEPVQKFIITCENILHNYREYRNQRYRNSEFKLSEFTPADEIINRIFAVLDAESYCDGPLMEYLQRGTITSWLSALGKRLISSVPEGNAVQESFAYAVREQSRHCAPIEAVAEEDTYLKKFTYTVEPADEECGRYLNNDRFTTWKRDTSGGVGMRFETMKLYYYEQSDYPTLSDFLDHLVYVKPTKELSSGQRKRLFEGNKTGAYPSYYSNDIDAIKEYLVRYIETFASGASVDVLTAISNYHGTFDTSYYGRNIVIYERYFESIFYKSSRIVADHIFEKSLLKSIINDVEENGFIRVFDCLSRFELYLIDFPGLFHFDDYSYYGGIFKKNKCLVCDRTDYYSSIKPFILFLSNFRLILSTYMAISLYGQCHFSICWETDTGEDMVPEEWPHPGRG